MIRIKAIIAMPFEFFHFIQKFKLSERQIKEEIKKFFYLFLIIWKKIGEAWNFQ